MSDAIWWTGVGVWTAAVSVILWAALHILSFAFDATWFLARCVFEGGTKKVTALNLWRIWEAGFFGRIHSVRAKEGYYIIFPGYGPNHFED